MEAVVALEEKKKLLVVAHGSRSGAWVETQRSWFSGVLRRLSLAGVPAVGVELTFLEIASPLFEDRLRQVVAEGADRLLIFPFFLSRSGHAGDEIPELAERIAGGCYDLVAPEGWEQVLGRNAERRLAALGVDPGDQVIVSGYGASKHDEVWRQLLVDVQAASGRYALGPPWFWAPSGHFMADTREPLRECLRAVAEGARSAILPLYLAVSSYQEKLIPDVIGEFPDQTILFQPDAVLPDPAIEQWAAELLLRVLQPVSPKG